MGPERRARRQDRQRAPWAGAIADLGGPRGLPRRDAKGARAARREAPLGQSIRSLTRVVGAGSLINGILLPLLASLSCGCERPSPAAPAITPSERACGPHEGPRGFGPRPGQSGGHGGPLRQPLVRRRGQELAAADYYLERTAPHLLGRAPDPVQDNQGNDVKLANILEAFENGQLASSRGPSMARTGSRSRRSTARA